MSASAGTAQTVSRVPKRPPIYHADCVEIPLTKGLSAFVDLDCPSEILTRSWCIDSVGYAACKLGGRMVNLHRVLLGLSTGGGQSVDHIDGNQLNNRRANLRTCTAKQNAANLTHRGGSSRFRGVSWSRQMNKWRAALGRKIDGKSYCKHVGYFADEEEAARAWDRAAQACGHYDPDFLRLNFPPGSEGIL